MKWSGFASLLTQLSIQAEEMRNHDCHSPGSNPSLFENRNRDFPLHSIGRELKHLPKKVKYRRRINIDEVRDRIMVVNLERRRESGLRLCWLFREDQMASRRILMLLLLSAMLAGFSETIRFLLLVIRRKENADSLVSHSERERNREISHSLLMLSTDENDLERY